MSFGFLLRPLASAVTLCLLASCAQKASEHTVGPAPEAPASPQIIGDGMEVRCYRVLADDQDVHLAISGLGGQLVSSNTQVLRGLEYYVIPEDRLDDLVSVIGSGAAWNIRWLGQAFDWQNLLPARILIVDEGRRGWVVLMGRTWSTMMETGPVVYFEAVPVVGYERIAAENEGRFALLREENIRTENVLYPGQCLVLVGGAGIPISEFGTETESPQAVSDETIGSILTRTLETPVASNDDAPSTNRDILVFIPRFSTHRVRGLHQEGASQDVSPPSS